MGATRLFTRRQIAKLLGLGASLPFWARRGAAAPEAARAHPAPPQEPQAAPPPGAQPLLEYIKANFGDRLTEDELREVGDQIARRLGNTALRDHPVRNNEEPDVLFRVRAPAR